MRQTSERGERAEAAVLCALVAAGKTVLMPFGSRHRYDLVYEEAGHFRRVQCKAGRHVHGVVIFKTCSETGQVSRDYRRDVDVFGVHCEERAEVYLVPVQAVGLRGGRLRIDPTRNGQAKGVRWAGDYLLRPSADGGDNATEYEPAGASAGAGVADRTARGGDHKVS